MVKVIPYVATLLAFGQAVVAAKAVTSFTEWVDGILENPNGDNMKPEEVIEAYKSGLFNPPPAGTGTVHSTSFEADVYENIAKFKRSLIQKRATCYEVPNTECLVCRPNSLPGKQPSTVVSLTALFLLDCGCCCVH